MIEPDLKAPVAAVKPHPVVSPFGVRIDPYYWLRDDKRADPEVLAYLHEENAFRERSMARAKPLEDALYQEIFARLKQDDSTVPYRKQGYWYNTRFEPGTIARPFQFDYVPQSSTPDTAPDTTPAGNQ